MLTRRIALKGDLALAFWHMRYLSAVFLILSATKICFSQSSNNQILNFDWPDVSTSNILVEGDTIVYYGIAYSGPEKDQWGILFAKLDSAGNILEQKLIPDSLGGIFAYLKNADIIKKIDGLGYVLTGSLFSRKGGFLMFLDLHGNLERYTEYSDNNTFVEFFKKVIETDDGFLIFGDKQKLDYLLDVFVLKVDKNGKKRWEKSYRVPEKLHFLLSARQLDNNRYLIGGFLNSTNPPPHDTHARIWTIDSVGNIRREWTSPVSNQDGSARDPQLLKDGGYLYLSGRVRQLSNQWQDWGNTLSIIKRDSAFNLVWRKEVSVWENIENVWIDLKPTPDGQWMAMGKQVMPESDNDDPVWTGGQLCKFKEDGTILWCRTDSAAISHPYLDNFNEYSGMGFLSSGSAIVAGQTFQREPFYHYKAWLVKVSPDGCIDTLHCQTTAIPTLGPPTQPEYCRVFPNPSPGAVHFQWALSHLGKAELCIFDLQGRLIHQATPDPNVRTLYWTAPRTGLYVYRLAVDGRCVAQGKFVIE